MSKITIIFKEKGKNEIFEVNSDCVFSELIKKYYKKLGVAKKNQTKSFFIQGKEISREDKQKLSELGLKDSSEIEVKEGTGSAQPPKEEPPKEEPKKEEPKKEEPPKEEPPKEEPKKEEPKKEEPKKEEPKKEEPKKEEPKKEEPKKEEPKKEEAPKDDKKPEESAKSEEKKPEEPKPSGKAEKKVRKALSKLGMVKVEGVNRVTMKQKDNYILYVKDPEVFSSSQNPNSFIIFGEMTFEDHEKKLTQEAIESLKKEGEKLKTVTEKKEEPKVEVIPEGEELSEEGLEKEAIETVMNEGKCSRQVAIKALRAHNGDPVEALLEIGQ